MVNVRVLLAVALDTWGVVTVVVAGALTELLRLTGLGVLEGLFWNFLAAIRVADSFLFRSTVCFSFAGLGGSSAATSNCE